MENRFLAIKRCLADLIAHYERITTEIDLLTRQYESLEAHPEQNRKAQLLKQYHQRMLSLQQRKVWYSKAYEDLNTHYQCLVLQCQQLDSIKGLSRRERIQPAVSRIASFMIAS